MITQYDDKGKIYTPVIQKKKVDVVVQTITHRIQGVLHIHPDERMKDELDKANPFVAITNASILDEQGNELYRSDFLAIHRDQIVWILPVKHPEAEAEAK